jgi:hypothetical protein
MPIRVRLFYQYLKLLIFHRRVDRVGVVYLAIAVLGEPQLAVSDADLGMCLVAAPDGARRRAVTAPMRLFHLCVPKIRFGVDAASGRRKLAS